MANLGNTFDSTQVEPTNNDVMPAGMYTAKIVNSEVLQNKNNQGQHIKLDLMIIDGEFANWHVWDLLNVWHPNPKAAQIAQGTLSAICRAVGVAQIVDTNQLHNLPMQIKVTVKQDPQYGDKNEVRGYKAIDVQGHQPSPGRAYAEQAPQQQMNNQPQQGYLNPDGSPMNPQQVAQQMHGQR